MSFKVNSSQQISFNDSVFSLTAREKKALDNSWAKIFADEIFPNIDEERFEASGMIVGKHPQPLTTITY